LESSSQTTKDKSLLSPPPLAGHSIFLYGREMQAVEHACEVVSDLLREYVAEDDKKRLDEALHNGWRKQDCGDSPEKTSGGMRTVNGSSDEAFGLCCAAETAPKKKARKEHSPSVEDGEIVVGTMHVASTSKILFGNQGNVTEDTLERETATSGSENADTLPGDISLSFQPTSENEADAAATLQSPQALLLNSSVEQEPISEPVAHMSHESEPGDAPSCPMTRIIKVPYFANEHDVKVALIGEDERNRSYLLQETGCDLQLKLPDPGNRSTLLDPMEVVLTGAFDEGSFDFAQRWVENRIIETVPNDQRCRMLYFLAKDNDYGACEGHARYQRAPWDLKTWVWMHVIELPSGFEKLCGLFKGNRGKAMKTIVRTTGCKRVILSDSLPRHVYICSPSLDLVNAAVDAVSDRVLWTLKEENERRKYRW